MHDNVKILKYSEQEISTSEFLRISSISSIKLQKNWRKNEENAVLPEDGWEAEAPPLVVGAPGEAEPDGGTTLELHGTHMIHMFWLNILRRAYSEDVSPNQMISIFGR